MLKDDQICRHLTILRNLALALVSAKLSINSVIIYLIAVDRALVQVAINIIYIYILLSCILVTCVRVCVSCLVCSVSIDLVPSKSDSKFNSEKCGNGSKNSWMRWLKSFAENKMRNNSFDVSFKGMEYRVTPWDKWFRYVNESFDLWLLYSKQSVCREPLMLFLLSSSLIPFAQWVLEFRGRNSNVHFSLFLLNGHRKSASLLNIKCAHRTAHTHINNRF